MSARRRLRQAIPAPLRQRVYDRRRTGRGQWRRAPGVERVPDAAGAVLTFDDGPDPEFTPALLEALAAAGATATFFVIGERLPGSERLLAQAAAAGHEIGLHGMAHRRHDRLGAAAARAELEAGLAAIAAAGAPRPRFYRPPFGASSPALAAACRELGLELAYWSAWGQDWEEIPGTRVAALVERDLGPGAVVLLHDSPLYAERRSAAATVAAVPLIAAAARRRGLALTTLGAALRG